VSEPGRPVGVEVARYMSAGLTLAASTMVFMLAGGWVGERLGSRPLGSVVGAFIGATAGFYWLVRVLTSGARRSGDDGDGTGE